MTTPQEIQDLLSRLEEQKLLARKVETLEKKLAELEEAQKTSDRRRRFGW